MDGVSEDTDWPTLTGVLARPDEFRVFRARKLDREPGFSGVVQAGVRLSAATPKRRNDFLLIVVLVLSSVAVVGVIVFLQNSRASGNGASGESGGGLLASVGPDTNPQDGNQPVARSGQQSWADASRSGNAESGDPSQATESGEEEGGGPPLSAGEALSEMSLEEKVGQLLFLGMTPGTVLDPQPGRWRGLLRVALCSSTATSTVPSGRRLTCPPCSRFPVRRERVFRSW